MEDILSAKSGVNGQNENICLFGQFELENDKNP